MNYIWFIRFHSHRLYQQRYYFSISWPICVIYCGHSWWDPIFREVFSLGSHPKEIYFKTPLGKKKVTIYSINDFSTFNLIFCRQDYLISQKDKIILDVGSNIGLSALYWLTRNNKNIVYCYEPSSLNFMRLKQNLKQFKSRFFLYKDDIILT